MRSFYPNALKRYALGTENKVVAVQPRSSCIPSNFVQQRRRKARKKFRLIRAIVALAVARSLGARRLCPLGFERSSSDD